MREETPSKQGGGKPPIVFERSYRADAQELWELWTTKDGLESWWYPEGSRAEVRVLEARQGGRLHYDMIAHTPDMIEAMRQMGLPPSNAIRARFAEFRARERLTLVHMIDFLPGVKPFESTLTVEFFPSGDRVRMVVTLHQTHDEEFTQKQRLGFTSQLSNLDERYASKL